MYTNPIIYFLKDFYTRHVRKDINIVLFLNYDFKNWTLA